MKNEYDSYADPESRGEVVFSKHMKTCRTFINLQMKPNEGSEGAGELYNRKEHLFLQCMKKKGWSLKP